MQKCGFCTIIMVEKPLDESCKSREGNKAIVFVWYSDIFFIKSFAFFIVIYYNERKGIYNGRRD